MNFSPSVAQRLSETIHKLSEENKTLREENKNLKAKLKKEKAISKLAEKEKQEEMMRVMRRGYCKKCTDYICVDAIGELIKPNYVTDHFKVLLKEKGLKPVRFHELRHSCASLLLANGVPMKMIQDWLGHSNMGTTANIYSHSESKKASAMAIGSALG